jgi:cysteinyl-tRNA synthetase
MMETVLASRCTRPTRAERDAEQLMRCVIAWRQELRSRKLYDLADRIRDDLKAIGIILEDTPQGTLWRMG